VDPQVEALGDATVLDVDGGKHKLREYLASRPAVVLFVRHFG
jgi:hypothetical protein